MRTSESEKKEESKGIVLHSEAKEIKERRSKNYGNRTVVEE